MTTKTTDVFQVEHIEYVTDRPLDEVASALEGATGDLTDGKYASEVASAKDKGDFEARARRFEADRGKSRSFMWPAISLLRRLIGRPAHAMPSSVRFPARRAHALRLHS